MLTFNVSAQNSELPALDPKTKVTVPLEFVIKAKQNQDKLTLAEAENASLKAQIAAYVNSDALHKEKEAVLESKVTNLEKQVKNAEDALALAQKNVGLTEQQKQLYVERLNEYREELKETREDLRRSNASKKYWLLGGAAFGYGAAKFK